MLEWIELQKRQQEENIVRLLETQRIERITEAIAIIISMGEFPTYEKVVDMSGVPKKYIRTHKGFKQAFEETRKNLLMSVHYKGRTSDLPM